MVLGIQQQKKFKRESMFAPPCLRVAGYCFDPLLRPANTPTRRPRDLYSGGGIGTRVFLQRMKLCHHPNTLRMYAALLQDVQHGVAANAMHVAGAFEPLAALGTGEMYDGDAVDADLPSVGDGSSRAYRYLG